MNKQTHLRLLLFLSALLLPAHLRAQDRNSDIPDKVHALAFFHRVQAALRANDPNQTAQLMHFPLRTLIAGKPRLIQSKTEFIHGYSLIFTSARISDIVSCKDQDVWYRDQGYSIPAGTIWFDDFGPNSSPSTKSHYQVMTVNEASKEQR